jgi:tRNA U34 2-thiouridine synthase MnmA/TrmU
VVVVGPRRRLGRERVRLRDARLHVPRRQVQAKLRYRSPAVAAAVRRAGSALVLDLEQPAFGVAAGQTAALYDGDALVGVGTITDEL